MVIDPTTDLGKLRLRCGDFGDISYLPDNVYTQTLADKNGNLYEAAKTCASYILGMLAFKTHRKMGLQLEIYGKEAFDSYKDFLLLTVTNPAFMNYSPIVFSASGCEPNAIIQFQNAWVENFPQGTENQQLNRNTLYSPNKGGLYGPLPLNSSEGL